MAKTVGNISKENGRDPVKREKSRKQDAARKKFDTKISQVLKRVFDENVRSRDVQKYLKQHAEVLENKEVSALQKLRMGMMYNRKEQKYELDAKRALELNKGYESIIAEKEDISTQKYSAALQARKNKLFEREMQQAKSNFGLSDITAENVNMFYRATSPLWKGESTQETRNSKIMEVFGVNDLETVFKLINNSDLKAKDFGYEDEGLFKDFLKHINENVKLDKIREIIKEEMRYAENNKKTGGNTNEAAYNGPTTSHKDGSPQYAMNIVTRIAELLEK